MRILSILALFGVAVFCCEAKNIASASEETTEDPNSLSENEKTDCPEVSTDAPIPTTPDPTVCPANEVYTDCNGSCQNDCMGIPKPCARICSPGCVCAAGYTRDNNSGGNCVSKCSPQNCPSGWSWNSNSSKCEVIQTLPDPTPANKIVCKQNEMEICQTTCPEIGCAIGLARCALGKFPNTPDCPKMCRCQRGFVRSNGACILKADCPNRKPKSIPS